MRSKEIDKRRENILNDYMSGVSVLEIIEKYCIDKRYLNNILYKSRKYNEEKERVKILLEYKTQEEIIELMHPLSKTKVLTMIEKVKKQKLKEETKVKKLKNLKNKKIKDKWGFVIKDGRIDFIIKRYR